VDHAFTVAMEPGAIARVTSMLAKPRKGFGKHGGRAITLCFDPLKLSPEGKFALELTATRHGSPYPLRLQLPEFQAVTRAILINGASHRFNLGNPF